MLSNVDKNMIIYMYAYLCVRVCVCIIKSLNQIIRMLNSNNVRMHHKYNYLILHN